MRFTGKAHGTLTRTDLSIYLLSGESSADSSGLLGSEVNGEELLTGELLSEL